MYVQKIKTKYWNKIKGDRIRVKFLKYNLLGGYRAEGNAKMKYEDGKFVIDVVSFEVDD